jgi:hypothetical protein
VTRGSKIQIVSIDFRVTSEKAPGGAEYRAGVAAAASCRPGHSGPTVTLTVTVAGPRGPGGLGAGEGRRGGACEAQWRDEALEGGKQPRLSKPKLEPLSESAGPTSLDRGGGPGRAGPGPAAAAAAAGRRRRRPGGSV